MLLSSRGVAITTAVNGPLVCRHTSSSSQCHGLPACHLVGEGQKNRQSTLLQWVAPQAAHLAAFNETVAVAQYSQHYCAACRRRQDVMHQYQHPIHHYVTVAHICYTDVADMSGSNTVVIGLHLILLYFDTTMASSYTQHSVHVTASDSIYHCAPQDTEMSIPALSHDVGR